MRNVLAALFSVLTLTGCATTGPYQITAERPRSSFPTEYGVIAGAFTTPDRWRLGRTAFVRNVETRKDYRISQSFAFHAGDFDHPDRKGVVFAFAVPPGRYEFYNYLIYSTNGAYETRWYSKEDFSVPFDVTPGAVVYLGDIQFVPNTGKNVLGMSVADGGFFRLMDEFDHDLPQLRAKYPDIDWLTAQKAGVLGRTLPPVLFTPSEKGVDRVVPPALLNQ